MASSQPNESTAQFKTCQCGENDKNAGKSSESADKQPQKCPTCQVIKSGPLFLSSKAGIGWTSWKKRWFVLTQTSLVFYRSDPNAPLPKGFEANPTLGGIDLVSSGSVVAKADKKLLIVSFPDGRDGRTFTLKGETSEELQEWKTALENALAQAPSAASSMGQSGIFSNEIVDSVEASFEQWKEQEKKAGQSSVIGRPAILALEDEDGSPSFLEKALRFIEDHGARVEGVLRQSADVEEVERREREYEQGRNEFSADEDAHIIGDCIKHVLREMPSSAVPASCCTALVEAYKIDRGNRIHAIRDSIAETFPEPNLRLLQRVLKMMLTVASYKAENRMSLSALAACMAPLLLRPLLIGDCEFEDNFSMGGDGSLQLLKAAAAANHAQAIVIIMLEEYEALFDEELSQDGSFSSEAYSDSEEDESTDNDMVEGDGSHHAKHDRDAENEDGIERSSHSSRSSRSSHSSQSPHSSRSSRSSRGMLSGSGSYNGSDQSDNEDEDHSSDSASRSSGDSQVTGRPSKTSDATTSGQDIDKKQSQTDIVLSQRTGAQENIPVQNKNSNAAASPNNKANNSIGGTHTSKPKQKSASQTLPGSPAKSRNKRTEPTASVRTGNSSKHKPARKNRSMESIDFSTDDEIAIQKLETSKSHLKSKVTEEVKGNATLQASLERRKNDLYERRLALEKDVEILREQLQRERNLRASLESGLNTQSGHLPSTPAMDSKTRADVEEINHAEADITNLNQKVADLRGQLSNSIQASDPSLCRACRCQLDNKEMGPERVVDGGLLHQNENSSTADIASSLADGEDGTENSQTSLPLSKGQSDQQQITVVNQDKMLPPESVSISSNEMPVSADKDAAPSNSASRGKNSKSGEECENRKAQTKDKKASRDSEAMPVASDSSKKSISKDENPKSKADTETDNGETQDQTSSTSADVQPSQKLPRQTTRSRARSNDTSSTEESGPLTRNFASKRSSFRVDSMTKDSQDSSSLPNKQLSKQQSSSAGGKSLADRHTASRKSFRSEDGAAAPSSSNALTRLTNRLNFLKERRVQLANELQYIDANKPSGTEQTPPPRTNSR